MLNEPVHVAEYSASWLELFESEGDRLLVGISLLPHQIVHIGSTAVPGLAAKPVIDIMLGIDVYPPSDSLIQGMVDLGYEALGKAGVSGRLYFRRRSQSSFNCHVVQRQGQHWISNLAMREYLRASQSARDRYAEAKRNAIASGATDLLSYSEHKTNTIAQLLSEALAFQSSDKKQPTH
jgi:GrpB-like predicted nucleotidyltransferase (UPF0157 family)